MKGCRNCFNDAGPTEVNAKRPERGVCDFCGPVNGTGFVWDLEEWSDPFAQLFDSYVVDESGSPIEQCLLADWDFFTHNDASTVRSFIEAVFPGGHEFLGDGVRVGHRLKAAADSSIRIWDQLIDHLKFSNRFFPPKTIPYERLEALGEVIVKNSRPVLAGSSLFRGRMISEPVPLSAADMGMPPRHLARGGRGNPPGIPHLYLALERETCVAECRPGMNEYISVAEFQAIKDFTTLDLETVDAINPFTSSPDGDASLYLHSRAVLTRLRSEISTPARSSDSNLDYISTQFLCEYVKSLGLSGVIYPSTLYGGGTNLVLFNPEVVEIREDVQAYRIVRDSIQVERAN